MSATYTSPAPTSLTFGPYQLATGGGGGNSLIGADAFYANVTNLGNGGQPWGGPRTGSGYGRAASFNAGWGLSTPGYPNSGGGGGGGAGGASGASAYPGSNGGSGRCVIWKPDSNAPSVQFFGTEPRDFGNL